MRRLLDWDCLEPDGYEIPRAEETGIEVDLERAYFDLEMGPTRIRLLHALEIRRYEALCTAIYEVMMFWIFTAALEVEQGKM